MFVINFIIQQADIWITWMQSTYSFQYAYIGDILIINSSYEVLQQTHDCFGFLAMLSFFRKRIWDHHDMPEYNNQILETIQIVQ